MIPDDFTKGILVTTDAFTEDSSIERPELLPSFYWDQTTDIYTTTESYNTTLSKSGSCQGGEELFQVSCSSVVGFIIEINEACRKIYFPFIDFSSSFVWGDSSKLTMDLPSGSTGVDVDETFSGTCKNVKFVQTGAGNSKSWSINVPFTDCGIEPVRKVDSTSQHEYTDYSLYWNSQTSSSSFAQIFHVGQVKMACRLSSFQLGGTSLSVSDNSFLLPNPPESQVDINSKLSLEIGKVVFTESTAVDETSLDQVKITSSMAKSPVVGQPSFTYTEAKFAQIGDYMQLLLVGLSTEVIENYA